MYANHLTQSVVPKRILKKPIPYLEPLQFQVQHVFGTRNKAPSLIAEKNKRINAIEVLLKIINSL